MTTHAYYTEAVPTAKNVDKSGLVNALPKLFIRRTAVDGLIVEDESLIPWSDKGGFSITLHTTSDKTKGGTTHEFETVLLDENEAKRLSEIYALHLEKALDIFEEFGGHSFSVYHTVEANEEDVSYKIFIKQRGG